MAAVAKAAAYLGASILFMGAMLVKGASQPQPPLIVATPPAPSPVPPNLPAPMACHLHRGAEASWAILPDPACTPGAVDDVIQTGNLQWTICAPGGFEGSALPESADNLKRQILAPYGFTAWEGRGYVLDWLVPPQLGGLEFDAANLWPLTADARGSKAKLETELHQRVCDGRMTLTDAQEALMTDWTKAYVDLFGPLAGTPVDDGSGA